MRLAAGLPAAIVLSIVTLAAAQATTPTPVRPVHRFLAVALSPDGTRVASVEGDSSPAGGQPVVRELVLRGASGGPSVTVALPCGRARECWPASPVWAPDGKSLAFALRTPGSHARSIYTVAPDGTGLTRRLAFDGTIGRLRYDRRGRLSMLATAGAAKEVGATEAGAPILGDLGGPPPEQRIATLGDDGALTFASPPDLYVYDYDVTPDGGFVGTAAPGDGDAQWWVAKLYAFDSGAAKLLYAPNDRRQQIADPRVSPDGVTVAFIGGLMSDFGSTGGDVYSLPLKGGPTRNLTAGMPASATSIGWSCDGALLVRLLAGDQIRIAPVGPAGVEKPLWSGRDSLGGDSAGLALACPARLTATVRESFTAPPEIAVGPIGAWRDLTETNAGLTTAVDVSSVTWKSDGLTVQGWLLRPKGATGKLPMITQIHGGPAAANVPGFAGTGLSKALLDRGYALFRPNPRGSFGQGEAFAQANVRDLGYGDLRDVLAGIDAVERVAPIDDARLGLTGGSYGGFMTMWAVTQTHRFKAGVAAAGISDWQSYYGENGINQWLIPYFGATVYDDPAIYARSSPITFIKSVTTPVLATVGAADIECPPGQTLEFHHALIELGVPASMAIYPSEGHGLRDPAHEADSERRALDWFDRYLK